MDLRAYDGLVVDLDGVVWVGDAEVPGATAALRDLEAAGLGLVFLTNDPRSSRASHAAKLTRLGYPADREQVVTSASATAEHLAADARLCDARVLGVGSPELREELAEAGLRVVDGGEGTDVVVLGGHEDLSYDELRRATQAVLVGGAELVATNRDPTFPMPDGPWPGTGALVAAVEAATGRRARSIGKPEAAVFHLARRRLGRDGPVAVVGDDPRIDVAGAVAAGLDSLLVLSGTADAADAAGADPAPTGVAASLAAALEGAA